MLYDPINHSCYLDHLRYTSYSYSAKYYKGIGAFSILFANVQTMINSFPSFCLQNMQPQDLMSSFQMLSFLYISLNIRISATPIYASKTSSFQILPTFIS